jgi:hypothetical protein
MRKQLELTRNRRRSRGADGDHEVLEALIGKKKWKKARRKMKKERASDGDGGAERQSSYAQLSLSPSIRA